VDNDMLPCAAVNYNAISAAFTPSMGKRLGTVFAAAPIVQGKFDGTGTPDVLTFSRGSQVVGNWYGTFDPYQGGLVVRITPEWNGDDGIFHWVFGGWNERIQLNKSATNYLICQRRIGAAWASVQVDASGWTAGTTYCVVFRWDTRNKLDGTNYLSVSVNDAHVFGSATAPDGEAASSTLAIGSNAAANPANAIIEGLTIYRRPLWDGTYGCDVGNGDEIAAIYAAGAGKDPCEVTGSWDVVFALPTNAVVGALTTGTGNAWSHPHATNLIPGNTNAGGWMADGTYGTDGWADEGTPSAVAALAAAEKIFLGGYKTTSDAANEGIYQDVVVVPGANWVIRVIAHSDGTSVPKAILYDQTNSAEIGSLTGSTASTRTAPDVLLFTGQAPAGCVTLRVKLINTAASNIVYWHQVAVMTDLWDDPSMEAGTAPTDVGTPTTSAQSAVQAHSDTNSWLVVADAADEGIKRAIATTAGVFYHASAWVYADTAGTVDMEGPTAQKGGAAKATTSVNDAWQLLQFVFRATAASTDLQFTSNAAQTFYVDDVCVVPDTAVSLTATPASAANSIESGGIRVDGYDKLVQPTTARLRRNRGVIRWKALMRHSPANIVKFVQVTGAAYLLYAYGDATNYVSVYGSAANTMTLAFNDGGGAHSTTWDCTAAWTANQERAWAVDYDANRMRLWHNGLVVATINEPVNFAVVPTSLYYGSNATGNAIDAVIKEI